jgi:FkbM family methyltransferase
MREEGPCMAPALMTTIRKTLKSSDFVQKNFRRYIEPLLPVSEPELYILRGMKFRTVLDVGANVGVYSVWLSRIADQVWSFEPLDYPLHVLRVLELPNVNIMPFALGDQSGPKKIYIPRGEGRSEHPLASLSQTEFAEFSEVDAKSIEVRRFDDLSEQVSSESIDFVKIDVEGFELNVLKGMTKLIEKQQPAFLIEIETRHNKNYREVFEFLEAKGYRAYFTSDGLTLTPMAFEQIHEFQSRPNFEKDVTSLRKFRAGDKKSYINNFFFLTDAQSPGWRAARSR